MNSTIQDPLQGLSLILQLERRARLAESSAALGFIAVNETRQLLHYRHSAIWLATGQLSAVSGLPEPEKHTPYSLWLNQVAQYCLSHPEHTILTAAILPDTLAASWSQWLPEQLLVLPFKQTQSTFALWLLARDEPWQDEEIQLGQALSESYAHAWQLFLPRPSWIHSLQQGWKQRRYKKRIALILLASCFIPVRLTVLAPAEVTAKDAFLVRAPLEGVIDQIFVRPNTPVKVGQPLFELDTTGLRMRLDVARKAYAAASEEYRQGAQMAVSDDEKSKLELTQRKAHMEEKAAELSYSEQLLNRVQVKSTKDGIAVFNDPHDWIGKAVNIGERVMQIADPNKREITIHLPIGDAITLPDQAPVTLYLTTTSQYSYDAQLSFIAYRAEVGTDGVMSYKLKANFTSNQDLPRLGLTGTAKLHGDWVPLIYYITRRPLATLRQYVGW